MKAVKIMSIDELLEELRAFHGPSFREPVFRTGKLMTEAKIRKERKEKQDLKRAARKAGLDTDAIGLR